MTVALSATLASFSFKTLWDFDQLSDSLGPYLLLGLCLIVFAECGLLIGFFLPGDILLFPAGMFCAQGVIDTPFWLTCVLLVVSAFLGNVVGYWIGWQAGPALFSKPNSKLFKREHVERTNEFFARYGARAIVIGRFVPIVRTFITTMAGVGRMNPVRYFTYSAIGGVMWAAGVPAAGYYLGKVAFVHDHFELVIIGIALLSVLPIYLEMVRSSNAKDKAKKAEAARHAAGRY
ncbi:DedA family protein [Streptomyces sp. NPDC057136]|uniref:DedA family protein n=1 Tax=Streptomyces sp. NPDC057136 TaxID=3346029 RepID=UPI00363A83A2